MKRDASYFRLGLFVLGAVAVVIAGIIVLSAGLFSGGASLTLETYVDGSVEGLQSGSEVHYQGIPVGNVSEVTLTADVYEGQLPFPQRRPYVLVRFEVGTGPFGGISKQEARRLFEDWVDEGLHVKRQPRGLSGMSYLQMDFVSEAATDTSLRFDWTPEHLYVPQAPGFTGNLSDLMQGVQKTLGQIGQIDFGRMGADAEDALRTAREAARELRSLLADPRLQALVADASRAAAGLDSVVSASRGDLVATADDLRLFASRLDTATAGLPAAVAGLTAALDQVTSLLTYQRGDLAGIVRNLEHATESLRALLERADEYPGGLIFGKPPPRVKP